MEKKCRVCGVVKGVEEFNRNRRHKDGYASECKICCAIWQKEYRIANAKPKEINPYIDLLGKVFFRWTVIGLPQKMPINSHSKWLCECECGVIRLVSAYSLVIEDSKSCGCYNKVKAIKHGQSKAGPNRKKTTEYTTWQGMKDRCDKPDNISYKNYGAKGVSYCPRWRFFKNFFDDMGLKPTPKHTLDRFPDMDGNYGPDNCRWATRLEQSLNRRRTRWIEHDGVRMTLKEWQIYLNIPHATLHARLKKMSMGEIISKYKK